MAEIKSPKKLIEVALPLDDINEASGKEKSVRHGHPSTLHLWWARRPLAAARAVLFAQMVNDPGYQRDIGFGVNKKEAENKREVLFQIIRDLVKWENTTNKEVLEKARLAIQQSWEEICYLNRNHPDASSLFDPQHLPIFHDPFAGGGTIPLEAKRLGFTSYGTDLNPIPVLINKCLIEVVGRFQMESPVSKSVPESLLRSDTSSLIADVKHYANRVLENATAKLDPYYPKISNKLTPVTWLWCRTVESPNPAANGKHTPLIKNPLIANKKGRYVWLDMSIDSDGELRFNIIKSKTKPDVSGTVGRKGATCLYTSSPIPLSYIREQGKLGKLGHRLIAAVVVDNKQKVYISGDEVSVPFVPEPEGIPNNEILHWSGCTNVCVYGMTRFRDLFTPRQLLAMQTFAQEVSSIHEEIFRDAKESGVVEDNASFNDGGKGALAYADAICFFLTCCLGRAADYWNSVTSWESSGEFVAHAFTKHALPMIWDFGEINPIGDGGGSWQSAIDWVARVIERLPSGTGIAKQHNAMHSLNINNAVISTDPPYYDNVPYSNLSDFFYIWARIALRDRLPEYFGTIQTPKTDELVASHSLYSDIDEAMNFFSEGMTSALKSMHKEANPAVPITIYYAFKQSESNEAGTTSSGWESFLESVVNSGFVITGTWPIRTERATRGRALGSNALASSIVLVCRKRDGVHQSISRRQFQKELREEMPESIETMIGGTEGSSPIAPVDLAQSAIGPGMAIFSKYDSILNQDGTPMSVHDALVLINRAITDYLSPESGSFDADTQFCSSWFDQYGWSTGPFGEADTLSRAKGTSVDGVREAGVVESGGGKVRLLKWSEYEADWDPTKDNRTPIWEACHQMIRRLNNQGESAAGELLAKMPEKGESIRQLAYHLYTLCERKKWAEDARAYNELIGSWHAIVAASHEVGHRGTQTELGLDF